MVSYNSTKEYPGYEEPVSSYIWNILYSIFLIVGVLGFVGVILAVTRQRFWGRYPVGIYIIAISVCAVFYLVVVLGGYGILAMTGPSGLYSLMKAVCVCIVLPLFQGICSTYTVCLLTFGLVDCCLNLTMTPRPKFTSIRAVRIIAVVGLLVVVVVVVLSSTVAGDYKMETVHIIDEDRDYYTCSGRHYHMTYITLVVDWLLRLAMFVLSIVVVILLCRRSDFDEERIAKGIGAFFVIVSAILLTYAVVYSGLSSVKGLSGLMGFVNLACFTVIGYVCLAAVPAIRRELLAFLRCGRGNGGDEAAKDEPGETSKIVMSEVKKTEP